MLDYRSRQVAAPTNNSSEKAEVKGGCVKGLAELPTCPVRTCFLYTCRWLMIHVAFYARCEHTVDNR